MNSTRHDFLVADSRSADFLPSGEPALVVTSPPYPMIAMWDELFSSFSPDVTGLISRGESTEAFRRMHGMLDGVWQRCHAALVDGGLICVDIGDAVRTTGGSFRLFANAARVSTGLEAAGFTLLPSIIWRKQSNSPTKFMGSGVLPGGAYVTMEHETIVIARKGELRRPESPEERARRRRSALFWEERNEWYSDLWNLAGTRQQLAAGATSLRDRSGAFPLELAYRLIAMHSWEGDLVLDPFAGTGTTTAGAMALARSSLAVEVDSELATSAIRSLAGAETTRTLRARAGSRLEAHHSFIRESERKPRHVNKPYSLPVVTSQETDLEIPLIAEVSLDRNSLTCTYEVTPG